MRIANDYAAVRDFLPQSGQVVVELWMKPSSEPDALVLAPFFFEGDLVHNIIVTNRSGEWLYWNQDALVPFHLMDGQGHQLKVVYRTEGATFDLYFDGVSIAAGAPLPEVFRKKRLTGIGLSSGAETKGVACYVDNLRITAGSSGEPL